MVFPEMGMEDGDGCVAVGRVGSEYAASSL